MKKQKGFNWVCPKCGRKIWAAANFRAGFRKTILCRHCDEEIKPVKRFDY